MQKCTAFSISSIADLMGRGTFDNRKEERRGYYANLPYNLTYRDVPYDKFEVNLKKLCII